MNRHQSRRPRERKKRKENSLRKSSEEVIAHWCTHERGKFPEAEVLSSGLLIDTREVQNFRYDIFSDG